MTPGFGSVTFKAKNTALKAEAPDNSLGPYLTKRKIDSIEIYVKTGIPVSDIRKMRSLEIEAIPAIRLYLISLMNKVENIEQLLLKIYPSLKLINTGKPISRNVKVDSSDIGILLFSLEDFDLDNLSYRTGIKRDRLLRLTKLDRAKIDAHELFLIEMAANKKAGDLFKVLYNDLKLNTPEVEAGLRLNGKTLGSKK